MFNKSLLVGAIALAAVGAASADGFYAGAGLGGTSFHDKMTLSGTYVDNTSTDQGNLGVIGGLIAGYTFNFANQMNLGLEAFGNATSAKITNNDNTSGDSFSVKARYNYGVRVLPGYQVTPDTTLYGILGYVRGNFKMTASTSTTGTSTSSASQTFNVNGFQVGVGSATNLAKNIAVRGDIVYSGYQSKTYSDSVGDSFKQKVNTLDGIASVIYKFG